MRHLLAILMLLSATPALAGGPLAMEFDGVNDYAVAADAAALDIGTSDFTFMSWVKKNDNGDWFLVFDKAVSANDNRYTFGYKSDDKIFFHIGNTPTAQFFSTSTITDSEWHHIAATADRDGNGIIYIDGVADSTSDISGTSARDLSSSADLIVGGKFDGSDHYFDGSISDVRIYNRSLSAMEIQAIGGDSQGASPGILPIGTDGIISGLVCRIVGAVAVDAGDTLSDGTNLPDWSDQGNNAYATNGITAAPGP